MKKDTHLVNIYLKIHNKMPLTMDDLRYLAEYSPECFEKTCKNVVYNMPEAKEVLDSSSPNNSATKVSTVTPDSMPASNSSTPKTKDNSEVSDSEKIENILKKLNHMEVNELPIPNVDADKVKNLLGNLYMELLFPNNDKDTFVDIMDKRTSYFDKKI